MDAKPDISWERVAAFVRQHTHDVRNGLNCLDLETALLDEFVTDDEGRASLLRVKKQVRSLAEHLRSLSGLFQDPQPNAAPLAARELLMIWREKHAALSEAPEVRWVDELGDEKVHVDAEMLATVFRELLRNAATFSPGSAVQIVARVKSGDVEFELREPKSTEVDTRAWGEPFSTTRRGGYGLGLWMARRLVEANGATIMRRYLPEEESLSTQIVFAAAP